MKGFIRDARKASQNLKKHGVSFDEAHTVFFDEQAIQFYDEDGSILGEDRFLLLGLSSRLQLLLVCHCVQESEDLIRIISARKATKAESKSYYIDT